MKPRINVLTLGVSDLARSLSFYRDGLDLSTKGITGQQFEDGAVVFFKLRGDLVLALYPMASLAKDANIPLPQKEVGTISIGHLVDSKKEVDDIMKEAENAGATVTDSARTRFWGGYSGYFHDPDGHLWEIAWNPEWSSGAGD